MLRRMIIPTLFGLLGTGILVSLGLWQLSRADEKAALIAAMEARIFQSPVPLPDQLDPERDRYTPVETTGRHLPDHVFVLSAQKGQGPGFHLISGFETDTGRRILVERGFLPEADRPRLPQADDTPVALSGNLHWPRDANQHTPPYDPGRNLFFAREIPQIAQMLNTEEVLIVLRAADPHDTLITPVPVYQVAIPDNHLGYAVQWFLMALAWAGMTVFFLWRIRAQQD